MNSYPINYKNGEFVKHLINFLPKLMQYLIKIKTYFYPNIDRINS